MLRAKRPLIAQAMLRPFFEAYEIVADVLRDAPAEIDEKDLTKRALGVGRQYVAQNRVRSNESVSALLFATARQVAADQHLLEPGRRSRRAARPRSATSSATSCATWTRSSRSRREQFYAREMERRALRSDDPPRHGRASRTRCAHAIRWARVIAPALTATPACAPAPCGRCCSASRCWPADRRGHRRAVARRRADRHRTARPGPGHHLRPAVRAGSRRDRRRRGRRVVPVRGVPGAAAAQRRARRRRISGAARRHRRVGGLDGVRGAAGAADRLRRHRPAAASTTSARRRSGRWPAWSTPRARGGGRRSLRRSSTVASIPVLRWSSTPLLFGGLAGHADSARAHRAFVGGRLARPGHQQPADPPDRRRAVGRRPAGAAGRTRCAAAEHADLAARRFSAVALWCFVAMALSGVVNALVRIRPGDLFDDGYGLLVVAKAVALCTLGVHRLAAAAQRRRCAASRSECPRPADPAGADRGGDLRPDVRRRRRAGPHPAARRRRSSTRRSPRSRSATTSRVRRRWRGCCSTGGSTSIFGTAAIVIAVLYLAGVRTAAAARRRVADGPDWWRGCWAALVLLFATSSGIGRYMPAMFSMHMAAHMLLSMLTPILLVLGAPGHAGAAGAAGRRARRSAGPARMASGRAALPGVAVPHQPDRRDGVVRRRVLRAVLRRHLRRRRRHPRRRTSR